MSRTRPYVFIGSSAEGLSIAEAIQANLDYECECHIWHQGLFGTGGGTLESLVRILDDFDFAILACLPDDIVIGREGEKKQMPRDNVLLELGMFIGRIGPDRVFMLVNRDVATKLPSDLAGITPASFTAPQSGNFQSAVGAACTHIKMQITALGKRKRREYDLHISATMCGESNWLGICVTVNNRDAVALPPHKLQLFNGRNHTIDLLPKKEGVLLPTQKRRYALPAFYGPQSAPSSLLQMFRKPTEDDNRRWTLRIVLEDSDTILYEDLELGAAIGDVLVRAAELGNLTSVEHDIARKMYRPE